MFPTNFFSIFGLLFASAWASADPPSINGITKTEQSNPPAFVVEFEGIKNEVNRKLEKQVTPLLKDLDNTKNPDQIEKISKRASQTAREIHGTAIIKVMEITRPNAAYIGAVEPLIWVIDRGFGNKSGDEAAELLTKHHLIHKQTIDLAYNHRDDPSIWIEPLLRAQLAAPNLPPMDRPRLLLALAMFRLNQIKMKELLAPIAVDPFYDLNKIYGKETISALRKMDVAKVESEVVDLFKELAEKYGTKVSDDGISYGDLANGFIFEIQNLSIHKTAPDIKGEDPEGVKFQLSDYRGKVVMLTFWGSWSEPCMALVPLDREINEKYQGRPFALIGVNSDTDKKILKERMKKANITWRSFWCGEKGPKGEIPVKWNVTVWPMVYVLDHKGVIRAKDNFGQSLDQVIEKLVREAEANK